MNSLDLNKYKRLARIFRVITTVMFAISVIIVSASVFAIAVVRYVPITDSILQSGGSGSISLSLEGLISYKLDPSSITILQFRNILMISVLVIAVLAAAIAPIFHQVAKILKTVEDDNPFTSENAKRLTIIGAVLIAGSFIVRFAEYYLAAYVLNVFKITNISVKYSADSNMLVMGFLMFILAGVFKYGTYLQQEYDETV